MENIYREHILQITSSGKHRQLPISRQDYSSDILNFSTNDYLGLSNHPAVLLGASEALQRYGLGSTGSRLTSGNIALHEALEQAIALGKRSQKSLVFPSGFQTNITALSALLDPHILKKEPLVFFDRLNHASLYQAVLNKNVKLLRYRHLDADHLEELLKDYIDDPRPKFIVTETVFGMDGDQAPLKAMIELARAHNACLYLDEAHATGLFGPQGYGLSTLYDLSGVTHVIMGTFSKALGGQGGYIAASENICEYLLHQAGGFIYTTSLAPVLVGGGLAAWNLIPHLGKEREHLTNLADEARKTLRLIGCNLGQSTTHIIPIILKTEAMCLHIKEELLKARILVSAIRPPTVPPGTARLRISLTSKHTLEDVERLAEALKKNFKPLHNVKSTLKA